MSEERTNNTAEECGDNGLTAPQSQPIELILNKKTGNIIFKSPDGQTFNAKATIIDDEEEGETKVTDAPPLTPEQFREALQRFSDLSLTWTADTPPRVKPASKEGDSVLLSTEFDAFQREYPKLPREVGSIAYHYITGSECTADVAGDAETLRKKIEIAKEFFLNEEYRAEFFFKHAIKVPYFSEIDWEVVIKAAEKNVTTFAGVAYALLSLHLDSPDGSKSKNQTLTVAVNTAIVDKLMATLKDVRDALEGIKKLTGTLYVAREKATEQLQNVETDDNAEMAG